MNSAIGLIAVIGAIVAYALSRSKAMASEKTVVLGETPLLPTSTALKPISKTVVVSSAPTASTAPNAVSKPIVVATPAPIKSTTTTAPKPTVKVTAAPLKPPTTASPTKTVVVAAPSTAPKTTTVSTARAPVGTSDQIAAARTLDSLLQKGVQISKVAASKIKTYQAKMGKLTADGIAGPLTKARAELLLGRSVSWISNDAARLLHDYVVAQKGTAKVKIKIYQTNMGGLVSDGIVGPKTKARYKALTGKTW